MSYEKIPIESKCLREKDASALKFEAALKHIEELPVSKPCWELKYCPYGVLVEDFPVGEEEEKKAIEKGWYVKFVDGTGWVECDKEDKEATPDVNRVMIEFEHLNPKACEIFGHDCPVFYVREPLSENMDLEE